MAAAVDSKLVEEQSLLLSDTLNGVRRVAVHESKVFAMFSSKVGGGGVSESSMAVNGNDNNSASL